MNRRLQLVLALAALVAIVGFNAWLRPLLAPPADRAPSPRAEIDYALDDFEASFFNVDGERTVQVSGPRLEHRAESREALILAPRFVIDPDGMPWQGTAERARIARDSQRLRLESNIEVEREHPRGPLRIRTERLDYDHPELTLHSPVPARLEQGGNSLSGGTLTAWIDDERMELHADVQAIYRPGGDADGDENRGAGPARR